MIVADTIINKDPQSYDGYKIKFEIFYSLKEYDKAFEILDTIVNRHLFKDQRDVKMLLGRIHYDLGNWYDSYHAFRAGHYYLEYIYKPLHHIKKIAQNKDTKAKDFLKSIEETEDSYSKMALDPLEATSYKKALKLFEKAGNFITKGTEEFRFYVHEC